MRLRLRPLGPFLAAVAFCCVAACSVSEPKAGLVVINGPDPQTLDPALATTLEDLRLVNGIFEGLTRYDPVTARPIPGLAESWEISPDGRVYLFHLRDKLFWSQGEPITAEDVVYSWRRVLDPQTAAEYAGQLYYLKNAEAYNTGALKDPAQVGVRALDPRTVRVELNDPTAFFLDLCAFQTLAVVPRQVIAKSGEQWLRASPLPTSGPYLLDAWRLNYKVRLRKNPFYWDAANTRTEVIDFLCANAPNTTLNLYQTGQADVIWDLTSIPNELVDELKKRPDYHSFPFLGTYFFRFNTTKKPFDDPRVRRALALALDKTRLVAKFLHAGETAADHLVPDGTANYQPVAGLGYDPVLARRLLAEAGFPGGRGFPRFHYLFDASAGGGGIHEQLAVELQHAWEEQLGLHADLAQMEKKVYRDAQSRLDYDLARASWIGDYNDPNTFLDLFRGNNGNNETGWKNDRYDSLVRQANQQTDPAARAALFQQAETILVREELPIVPIYFYAGFTYFDPRRVQGIYPNIIDIHPPNCIYKAAAN
jgi:oligopeptide transport system substrate-binding protein